MNSLTRTAEILNLVQSDLHRDVERMTIGQIHQAEHAVRDALDICNQHPQRAYRHDITALLGELDYEAEDWKGFPSLDFHTDEDMARALSEILPAIVKLMPRKAKYVNERMHIEGRIVYWSLEAEQHEHMDAA